MNSQRHLLKPYSLTVMELTINSIYAGPEVRRLSIQQRKCKFSEESELIHSPVYSYKLCVIECRIQLALKLCSCTPYYYRRISKFIV